MAKDNVKPKGEGVAETAPVEKPVSVSSIDSEEIAISFVKREYSHLKGLLLVTQDKNVFTEENMSSGANHADKNNLKSFRVQA